MSVLIMAALCVAVVVLGLERRVRAVHDGMNDLEQAKQAAIKEAFANGLPQQGANPLQPEQWLTVERRRLEQTRLAGDGVAEVTDCSSLLAELLSLWPAEVHAETDSVSVSPTSIMVVAARADDG